VFSSDVYFLSRLPAKVDWIEVSGDRRLRARHVDALHAAAGLASLAASIRWRRFAMSDPVLSIRGLERSYVTGAGPLTVLRGRRHSTSCRARSSA
jgi:hypothetical protein